MRQKILISAALIHDPSVIVFDEPCSGLDVGGTLVLRSLVRRLAADGRIILYSSHVLEMVEQVCTQVLILHEGRVAAQNSVSELRRTLDAASLGGRVPRARRSCRRRRPRSGDPHRHPQLNVHDDNPERGTAADRDHRPGHVRWIPAERSHAGRRAGLGRHLGGRVSRGARDAPVGAGPGQVQFHSPLPAAAGRARVVERRGALPPPVLRCTRHRRPS